MHKGLQMLWLRFLVFLRRCSDSGRKDPLFLFFDDGLITPVLLGADDL